MSVVLSDEVGKYSDFVARQQLGEKYENRWIYLYSIFCVVILLFSSVVVLTTRAELQRLDDELRADVDAFKYLTDSAWIELNRLELIDSASGRTKRDISFYATSSDSHQTTDQECPSGPPGEKGVIGDAGEPGANGVNGNPGHPGGNYVYESMKTPCIWCPTGVPGPRGPRGDAGPSGQPGADGTPGADAADGLPGPKGPPSDPGPVGPPGKLGPRGEPGASASRVVGTPGRPGRSGAMGPPGIPGEDGVNGEPGQPGPAGQSGPDGFPGVHGISGAPGNNGSPGDDSKDVGYCECPKRTTPVGFQLTRPIVSNTVERPLQRTQQSETDPAPTAVEVSPSVIVVEVKRKVH